MAKQMVEKEMEVFRGIQNEIQEWSSKQQTFLQQGNENAMVQSELELLKEEDKVYKLVGPVLIRQDKDEAISNVKKRLEFIQHESDKLGTKINEKEKVAMEVRQKISNLQTEMQKNAAESVQAIPSQ